MFAIFVDKLNFNIPHFLLLNTCFYFCLSLFNYYFVKNYISLNYYIYNLNLSFLVLSKFLFFND